MSAGEWDTVEDALDAAQAEENILEYRRHVYRAVDLLGNLADKDRDLGARASAAAVDALYAAEYDTAEALMKATLPHLMSPEDVELRSGLLHNLAIVAEYREDFDQAKSLNGEALLLAREARDPRVQAECLHGIGTANVALREYHASLDPLQRCLSIFEELGDEQAVAATSHTLAIVYQELDDWSRSAALFETSVGIWRASSYGHGLTEALQGLGEIAQARGDYHTAAGHHADALPALVEMREWPGVAESLEGVALGLVGMGKHCESLELFGAATGIRDRLGDPVALAVLARVAGVIADARAAVGEDEFAECFAKGRAMQAEVAVERALSLFAALEPRDVSVGDAHQP